MIIKSLGGGGEDTALLVFFEVNYSEAEVFRGMLLVAGFSNIAVTVLKYSSFKALRARISKTSVLHL